MTTLEERAGLLKGLTEAAGAKEAMRRLGELVEELPRLEDAAARAKAHLAVQEDALKMVAENIAGGVEGKNEAERKAALNVKCQTDKGYLSQLNLVNTARGALLDATLHADRSKRQWVAIHTKLGIFRATLLFLAGWESEGRGAE